nr:MAG TPA: hypothetical protein [Bacteriophage sp.]
MSRHLIKLFRFLLQVCIVYPCLCPHFLYLYDYNITLKRNTQVFL